MLFFGHIGITAFLAVLLYMPFIFAAISSILPDIFDKVLFATNLIPCGRYFGHSIFFGPIFGFVIYLISRRKDYAIATTFGSYLHLIEDVKDFVPWLAPFIHYNYQCPPTRIGITEFEIITEAVGLIALILVFAYRGKLIKLREKIWKK